VQSRFDHRVGHRLDGLLILRHSLFSIETLVRREHPVFRRDVHDHAVLLHGERSSDDLCAEKRTRQADGDVRVPLLERKRLEAREVEPGALDLRIVRRVVDEDVHAPGLLAHARERVRDGFRAGDIAPQRNRRHAERRLDLARMRRRRVEIEVREHWDPAGGRDRLRVPHAHEPRAARDDRDAAGEREIRAWCACCPFRHALSVS